MINIRLWKELESINKTNSLYFTAGPIEVENLYKWEAILQGPEKSPYKGGIFNLSIDFNNDFPFKPPDIKFKTLIFHPNINFDGEICIDILKNKWISSISIIKVLEVIHEHLESPKYSIPFVPQIAVLLMNDKKRFEEKAKEWTKFYAISGEN